MLKLQIGRREVAARLGHLKWFATIVVVVACRAGDATAPAAGRPPVEQPRPDPAVSLSFSAGPDNGLVGLPLADVAVTVRDSAGNVALGYGDPITIQFDANAGGATLSGTMTVAPLNGVARFTTVRISSAGSAFTLRATATGLSSATSQPFDVVPAAQQIAFVSDREGVPSIYVENTDGSGLARLTGDDGVYGHPSWSPDASKLAFEKAGAGIWVMNADGTGEHQVALDGFSPAWSADGSRIRLARSAGPRGISTEIDDAAPDGSGTKSVVLWALNFEAPSLPGDSLAYGSGIRWSPDLSRVAFTWTRWQTMGVGAEQIRQIFVMNADGTDLHSLVPDLDSIPVETWSPAWSPDGTRIAFFNAAGLNVIAADGTSEPQAVLSDASENDSAQFVDAPSWSPDGSRIAVVRGRVEELTLPAPPYLLPEIARTIWVSAASVAGSAARLPGAAAGWDLAWAPR
jgi:dipeptidyl aminopeptidase/acylaminoacyl peptidase